MDLGHATMTTDQLKPNQYLPGRDFSGRCQAIASWMLWVVATRFQPSVTATGAVREGLDRDAAARSWGNQRASQFSNAQRLGGRAAGGRRR